MKKGINQWCFPTGLPLHEVFRASQRAGFAGVELNVGKLGDIGLTLESNFADTRLIKELAANYDIELKSLSTALMWEFPLSASDESIRMQGFRVVQKQLELAADLEIETILVVPGLVTESVSYTDCYERSKDMLTQLARRAETLGVQIGVENVWNKFLLSPREMVEFVDSIQSRWLGVYFDVGNVVLTGYPDQWIKQLDKRIFKIHVKDFNSKVGNMDGFVPLLAGDVNWAAVQNALYSVGYNDYVTAELVPYSYNWEQLITETSQKLDAIFS